LRGFAFGPHFTGHVIGHAQRLGGFERLVGFVCSLSIWGRGREPASSSGIFFVGRWSSEGDMSFLKQRPDILYEFP
jgi:hypothetical protein